SLGYFSERRGRKPRRCDIDSLLKKRAVQRIWLVEHREHAKDAISDQAFEGDLGAWYELFGQRLPCMRAAAARDLRISKNRAQPEHRGDELAAIIRPYYAAARRKECGLYDAGISHSPRYQGRVVIQTESPEAGHWNSGQAERFSH